VIVAALMPKDASRDSGVARGGAPERFVTEKVLGRHALELTWRRKGQQRSQCRGHVTGLCERVEQRPDLANVASG
jgi:hypothetical protein